jgi:hypothetical protein
MHWNRNRAVESLIMTTFASVTFGMCDGEVVVEAKMMEEPPPLICSVQDIDNK